MPTANDDLPTFTASLSANPVIQVAANLIRPVVEQAEQADSGHAGLSLLLAFCIQSDHKYLLQQATLELGHKNVLHMLVRLSIQLASAGHHLCQVSNGRSCAFTPVLVTKCKAQL